MFRRNELLSRRATASGVLDHFTPVAFWGLPPELRLRKPVNRVAGEYCWCRARVSLWVRCVEVCDSSL